MMIKKLRSSIAHRLNKLCSLSRWRTKTSPARRIPLHSRFPGAT